MRVLHLDTASGWRGGQNQVLLPALGQSARGHDVAVACREGGALAGRVRATSLRGAALPFRGDLWLPGIVALARELRRLKPDVVQLHDPHAVGSGRLAAVLAGRPPLVATRRVDFALRGPFSRGKYRGCARVIAVSRAIAGVLRGEGIAASKLRLVYEGGPDLVPPTGG